jgi:aminoglycoside 3-N-acetyltransferase
MDSQKKYDYTLEDIARSLREAGICRGDSIFIHSNIGFFGALRDAQSPEEYYLAFKKAIFSVIGSAGTLVVPTFSYSFCWGKSYNRKETPSVCGFF